MRKFERLPCPDWLLPVWERWGADWESLRDKNPKAQFHWRERDGTPANRKLLPTLLEQTQGHCSFCDNYPLETNAPTVEHFRPKSQFPRLAYQWENLYACCHLCQTKGDEFDEALLRPDAPDYRFDRYFYWDYTTGELCIAAEASHEDKARAETTRRLYRLNHSHPRYRLEAQRKRSRCPDIDIDEFPYRDFISPPPALAPT